MPKLSVVIPCYYNEQNIPVTVQELINNEAQFPQDVTFEYVFVDDGSGDHTLQALLAAQQQYPDQLRVVQLAGNVGSYNAIVAGIAHATGDCLSVITADLQDPPELMAQMYGYWQQGFKLVIGNRQDRAETGFAKWFAQAFHWLMKRLALRNIPDGGFDFVFFDRQVANEVTKMHERNSNVFYLMVWLGFAYVSIPYVRRKREIGSSRWSLSKKIKLLIDSLLSFSYFPIRAISVIGLSLGIVALVYGLYIIALKIVDPQGPPVGLR
ncbi:glycosyltransferase family 2 protein [Hymenobacter sp. 5516J-16]|uniref:glycosyltransferase family 2 protein n=1 Tax=Hymenobacter sp. 5516J-16 TaxID=2932253 RepID=UPI001FD53993|nr:glycosyltransferase family 2 protein [Hymenobacter sp. 5516J-16]UOQ76163.1 glycosyltransferase family 2 protein [Hymenobacter sp. 5516J-16]